MKKTIWHKKIPTLLGILLIAIGVFTTSYLAQKGVIFKGLAAPSNTPQNIRITNVSDSTFTVSYTTESQVSSHLNYGKDTNFGQIAFDERDKEGSFGNYQIHNINVKNLFPSTKYLFSITSGSDTFQNNDLPFEVLTAPVISSKNEKKEISGRIVLLDETLPSEAIVYATSQNAQVLSTLVKPDGSYSISLTPLRSADLSSVFEIKDNLKLKLLVVSQNQSSNVDLFAKINPIPTIILSKDYDFTISETPLATTSAKFGNLPLFPQIPSSKIVSPQITTPSNNQSFQDQQPVFKGTGLPNESVKITIQSTQAIEAQTTTDSSGNWTFRPSSPLTPGEHQITIVTKDASGVLRTVTSKFIVFASGTQVSQAATPSGTVKPTPTPSLTPSPTPTPSPIALVLTPSPTPPPKLAPTGSNDIPIGILGISVAIAGAIFLLLSRLLL